MNLFSKPQHLRHRVASFFLALPILTAVLLCSRVLPARGDEIDDAFTRPPATARPLVYWFWMGRNVTREGITGDLEALRDAGFGGATMCNLSDVCTPWPGVIGNSPLPEIIPYVSEEWWQLLHHAAAESHRLGLEFGFHNCPGYESNGGPWIPPELSMQEICFSQTPASGPGEVTLTLPRPSVNPRARKAFPMFSEETGKVEKPEIPARKTYYRDIAVLALPAEGVAAKDQVLDLSSRLGADGQLRWAAPAGRWIVYRFGHTTTGALIQPAPWKATGLECDKMNPEAVAFHLNHVIGELKTHCADVIGKGLDFLWFDSYEAGTPDWTPRMREEFQARRGYDLTPFLATFAKRTVGGEAESQRFAADFKRTIADLYRDVDIAVSAKLAHAAGLQIRSEPYVGPWVISEVIPSFDQVAAEFWTSHGKYRPMEVASVSAGARQAGQNVINAEAFTAHPADSLWNETPAWLKPIGDAAFCDGINRLMLHRFTHEPFGLKYRPGIVMGQWGTHFDRTQTWWEPGKAWVRYLQRCQGLLQWGERVAAADDFRAVVDAGGGAGANELKAIHRRGPAGDAYFVANLQRESRSVRCEFAVAGRQPEWWDPVTGATRDLPDFTSAEGRTTIPLEFDAAQSAFIVFRKPLAADPASEREHPGNFAQRQVLAELTAPWRVSFDPQWGGPAAPVEFAALTDWTQRPEPGVRYYSGTAVYRTGFDLPSSAGNAAAVSLDLGVVHDLARVRVNGRDLGVVWTAPWRVAVPAGLLKPQGNQLEIELTDCWANRLIGDEQEPADCEWTPGFEGYGGSLKAFPDWFAKGGPREVKGRYTFTTWNYFTKDSKLIPAGLLGPVRLMTGGL